jgi:hypothetical protein
VTGADWHLQRRSGILAIAVASLIASAIWFGIRFYAPPIADMAAVGDRMLFALKCVCFAVLFCLVLGVEAVAHERLQSPAFDPLAGHCTRRLEVNQRYLQNTLEQTIVFAAGLFGLAAYCADGGAMRAVLASTVVWVLARFAFWIGYHHSAAMRGIGAPGMVVSMVMLLYVVARASYDAAGTVGAAAALGLFGAIEAVLFWTTRERRG